MLWNTNCNLPFVMLCSAKKVQVSSRVNGCLGEVLQFREGCKCKRRVDRNVNNLFVFMWNSASYSN